MKLEFSGQIFEKSLNIKFHENTSIGSRVRYGRTDWHDEANSHFSQFCESAYKGKAKHVLIWHRTMNIIVE
jgi:hypothetical protein